jgi:hypothetical protein
MSKLEMWKIYHSTVRDANTQIEPELWASGSRLLYFKENAANDVFIA